MKPKMQSLWKTEDVALGSETKQNSLKLKSLKFQLGTDDTNGKTRNGRSSNLMELHIRRRIGVYLQD